MPHILNYLKLRFRLFGQNDTAAKTTTVFGGTLELRYTQFSTCNYEKFEPPKLEMLILHE